MWMQKHQSYRVWLSDLWIAITKEFFMKFVNRNWFSVRIFFFRKITKFLFTRQTQQFAYILLQKVWNWTLFSRIAIAFLATKKAYSALSYQRIIQKKKALFSKNSVILQYFQEKLSQKCPFLKILVAALKF